MAAKKTAKAAPKTTRAKFTRAQFLTDLDLVLRALGICEDEKIRRMIADDEKRTTKEVTDWKSAWEHLPSASVTHLAGSLNIDRPERDAIEIRRDTFQGALLGSLRAARNAIRLAIGEKKADALHTDIIRGAVKASPEVVALLKAVGYGRGGTAEGDLMDLLMPYPMPKYDNMKMGTYVLTRLADSFRCGDRNCPNHYGKPRTERKKLLERLHKRYFPECRLPTL